MAFANSTLLLPFSLLQIQVMDLPTEIAVLGILLMIKLSLPITASIFSMLNPVIVEMITCLSVNKSFILSRMAAKIKISEFSTAILLSFVTVTLSYFSNSAIAVVSLLVRYILVAPLLFKMPLAIESPKLPVPIMAVFMFGVVLSKRC